MPIPRFYKPKRIQLFSTLYTSGISFFFGFWLCHCPVIFCCIHLFYCFRLGAVLISFSSSDLGDSTAKKIKWKFFSNFALCMKFCGLLRIYYCFKLLLALTYSTLTEAFNCIHATFQISSFDVNFLSRKYIILKIISF